MIKISKQWNLPLKGTTTHSHEYFIGTILWLKPLANFINIHCIKNVVILGLVWFDSFIHMWYFNFGSVKRRINKIIIVLFVRLYKYWYSESVMGLSDEWATRGSMCDFERWGLSMNEWIIQVLQRRIYVDLSVTKHR